MHNRTESTCMLPVNNLSLNYRIRFRRIDKLTSRTSEHRLLQVGLKTFGIERWIMHRYRILKYHYISIKMGTKRKNRFSILKCHNSQKSVWEGNRFFVVNSEYPLGHCSIFFNLVYTCSGGDKSFPLSPGESHC